MFINGGNLFCLVVLKRAKYLKTSGRLFLTSLSCSYLSVGLFVTLPLCLLSVLPGSLPTAIEDGLCLMTSAGGICGSIATVQSLFLVNIVIYFAIEFPFHNVKMISNK